MSGTRQEFQLIAGGDIMFGEHPIMVGRGTATSMRRAPDQNPLAGIAESIRSADLSLANLECVLSDPPPGASPTDRECRGPAIGIRSLQKSGFTALNIANNHFQQHGLGPCRQTVNALDSHGFGIVGLAADTPGRCQPVDMAIEGIDVRLLGYSLRPRQHFSETPLYAEGSRGGILADVESGYQDGRIVIVSIHWGDEFVSCPSSDQVTLGRDIIEAGASLVLGHHPHVLQGWERYKNGAIIYSLGNLLFDMPWQQSLCRSALFRCTLTSQGVGDVKWIPLEINDQYRPQLATENVGAEISRFLGESRKHLEAGSGQWAAPEEEQYLEMVARAGRAQRAASHKYFMRNLFRYEPAVLGSILGKFAKRRLGILRD